MRITNTGRARGKPSGSREASSGPHRAARAKSVRARETGQLPRAQRPSAQTRPSRASRWQVHGAQHDTRWHWAVWKAIGLQQRSGAQWLSGRRAKLARRSSPQRRRRQDALPGVLRAGEQNAANREIQPRGFAEAGNPMTGQDGERSRTGCGCGKQILLRIAHELAPGAHQKAWPLPLRRIVRTPAPATRATPAEQSRDFILTLLNPRHRRFLIRGFTNMQERADEVGATMHDRSAVPIQNRCARNVAPYVTDPP